MAAFYLLLCEADPKRGDGDGQTGSKAATRKPMRGEPKKARQTEVSSPAHTVETSIPAMGIKSQSIRDEVSNDGTPSLHIDVQIHISADASAEQIDQVFASMAKHLYRKG